MYSFENHVTMILQNEKSDQLFDEFKIVIYSVNFSIV